MPRAGLDRRRAWPGILLTLTLVFLLCPVQAMAATAQVRLTRSVGPPTTSTTLKGRGFGSSEVVDVTFDETGVGSATTSPGGNFSLPFTVPAAALPGSHTVAATGETSGSTASTSFLVRTDWPQLGFDPSHSGLNPHENVLNPSTVAGLQLAWSASVPGPTGLPIVVGGRVYIESGGVGGDALVIGYDAVTGQELWKRNTHGGGNEGLTADSANVYVSTLGGGVYAYDAVTGAFRWFFAGAGGMSAPSLSGEMLYVSSIDDHVYAISAATGAQLWKTFVQIDSIASSPAISGGMLYVGTGQFNRVAALDSATGALRWSAKLPAFIDSSPSVQGGIVYVGCADHNLYALDAATGGLVWKAATGDQVNSSPAVAGGIVYVGSDDNNLYAFNAATGVLVWKAPTETYFNLGSPVVAAGVVYAGPKGPGDGHVYAFDALSGTVLWSYQMGDSLGQWAAVTDGHVYAPSFDGHIYAFALP